MGNKLKMWLDFWKLDEIKVLNALQGAGISDHCTTAASVARGDCQRSIDWLEKNFACPELFFS